MVVGSNPSRLADPASYMPEVYIPHKYDAFANAFKRAVLKDDHRVLWQWDAEKLTEKHDVELIGCGGESVVLPHPESTDKLVSIGYWPWDHECIVGVYYFQNLMATLFPHNFPRFHAVFAGDFYSDEKNGRPSGIVREKFNHSIRMQNVK